MKNILKQVTNIIHHDVLIIGSGAAGNSLALMLPDNLSIGIISKSDIHEGSTYYAQGGISAVFNDLDSIDNHIEDTLETGCGLCRKDVVRDIARKSRNLIKWLQERGVEFSHTQTKSGSKYLDLGMEGGHSYPRIVHADDKTGKVIQESLIDNLSNTANINTYTHRVAIDLIIDANNACVGCYIYNDQADKIEIHVANFLVLASGGANKAYLYTSNPDTSSGDGIAMAYRAGCNITNMEFMQFHPTCMYNQDAKFFLITEAMRGEGAKLLLPNGEKFMHKYDDRGVLAPRDIVARAIDNEMKKNGHEFVLLDISHMEKDFIIKRFPSIYNKCLEYGIDITKNKIPVVPATHYTCGGVEINKKGQTNIKNLYAIGEVAHSGLHGANRMASNSLLECLYFADVVSKDISLNSKNLKKINTNKIDQNKYMQHDELEKVLIKHCWKEIRTLMWNYVGIVRNNHRLSYADQRIKIMKKEIDAFFFTYKINKDIVELKNLVCVAELIIKSAISRKESRGLHYNIDYPETLSEPKDTTLSKNQSSSLNISSL